MREFTVGSVFSGGGGMDLGLEQAGMTVSWQIEVDEYRRAVLAKHWPGTRRFSDVKKITGRGLSRVDLICGGFPCQDLSVAGQRKGLAGERSGLFFELARVVKVRRPRWILIENVPGLLSQDEGEAMGTVIETFSQLGYGLAWRVLDSRYFGVPQRRRRVFIAGRLGEPCPREVLFEPEGGSGDPAEGGEAGPGVAYALTASVRGTGDGHGNAWNTTYVVGDKVSAPSTAAALNPGHEAKHTYPGDGGTMNLVVGEAFSENQRGEVVMSDYSHQLTSGGGKPDQGYPAVITYAIEDPRGKQSGGKEVGLGVREGDMYSLQAKHQHGVGVVAPTLSAKNEPASSGATRLEYYNTTAELTGTVRRLTPVECERLQGFPELWTCLCGADPASPEPSFACSCPDARRYALCGDAVTTVVARWIGTRMLAVDRALRKA